MNWKIALLGAVAATGAGIWVFAQEPPTPVFKAKVDLVVLTFTVTDSKGNYVTNLHPSDFAVTEDGIAENIATFEEGNGPTTRLAEVTAEDGKQDAGDAASPQGRAHMGDSASLSSSAAGE